MTEQRNIKRLARNTVFLYIRMLILLAVSLYTSRVTLSILGIDDYGIYNTLAGVVVMFAFLNNAMVTTTQRFLNYYLGKKEIKIVATYFSISFFVHVCIGLIVTILAEVIGLWFLYNKMTLPPDRFNAAFWTLQISVLVTFVNVIRSPYNACIIAFEKMDFYAYFSIVEALLKLSIVLCLSLVVFDKLIMYNILLLVVSIIVTLVYIIYCNRHFEISRLHFVKDKLIFRELFNFSSFSILGNGANAGAQYGVNMIINSFSGVAVNAAVGVSNQLSSAIYSFISNFQVAFNPVLVKTYAQDNIEELKNIILKSSKLSFFVMLIISNPIMFYMDEYLGLWLKEVPTFTAEFCILTLMLHLVDSIASPLWMTVQASGKIKSYQVITSLIIIFNIPLAYIFLKLNQPVYSVFVVKLILGIVAYFYRYYKVTTLINLNLGKYLHKLLFPIFITTVLLVVISFGIKQANIHYILSSTYMIIVGSVFVLFIGMTKSERNFIITLIMNKISSIKK